MDIIEYFDFTDTRRVFIGDEPSIIPTNSETNFIQLVDHHNQLVAEFNEFKRNLSEEIQNIKYYTK